MKFNDMNYERLKKDVLVMEGTAIERHLKDAQNYAEARAAFLEWQQFTSHINTMAGLCSVRHEIDTKDAFYDKEQEYWDAVLPELEELFQSFTLELLKHPCRNGFEEEFGSLLFKNAEIQLKTFKPEIVAELQEENRLVTEYSKLLASAQIPFDGKVLTLSQLTPYKQSADDAVRFAAWQADANFYSEHGVQLDEIYDKLVKVRDGMAKKMGYQNYVELGYYRMMRNSYTEEDVKKFREAVVKYLVPLATELKKEQAHRIQVDYPLSFHDDALSYRSGNALPQGSAEDILAHGKKMYHEMSEVTGEFIDFMFENELLDVLSKTGKAGGGFCTEFPDYHSPFIFANFNGTQHDVEVMTHEAGHAFASYLARDIVPMEYRSPTLESCEIHSMSMEFFAWPWAEGFFGKDTAKFYYGHLEAALTFIPYGTMVDHYQHIVYEHPEYTPQERHAQWKRLEGIYRPWLKLADLPFYGEGKGWQRQTHIYQVPFYYIDYCLAQAVALQFWAAMQKDRPSAWQKYLSLVKKAGTLTFKELVDTAGLDTPFGNEGLSLVASTANAFLSAYDKSSLK